MSTNVVHAEFRCNNFEEIRNDFARDMPFRIDSIRDSWKQIKSSNWSDQKVDTIINTTHTLAGSSVTFGFNEIGKQSRLIQDLLIFCYKGKRISEQTKYVVELLIDEIEQTVEQYRHS